MNPAMKVIQPLEQFLNPSGGQVLGVPLPKLNQALGKKLIDRVKGIKWYLNRYSLELNFKHSRLSVEEFLAFARELGVAGAQLHVAKENPRTCLSGEMDDYLRDLAEQKNMRKLDLQLDISSTEKSDVEEAVRIARAMGLRLVRCYIRTGGTAAEIITKAAERLRYAAELGEKWNLEFLLEQHEFLTGAEMVEIVEKVDSPRLGILFDFGNPVCTGCEPLEDLSVMQKYIRGVHCKDVRVIKQDGHYAQVGVRMGQGDLNLPKLFFDLLMLGTEGPQVKFFSIQTVVDYMSAGQRLVSDLDSQTYQKRPTSQTNLLDNLSAADLAKRLQQERDDAKQGYQYCKDLVANLKKLGSTP